MEEESGRKVRALIDKATNSTAAEVDYRLLKAIKSVVRCSDSELRVAAQTLMDLMKRDHSQVRYLTLIIIDELFMRSKVFRTLIVENFDQLLSYSVGFRRNLPLPAPPAVASHLRSKAIEFLEKWNASYGVHYRQIRLGFDYLKNTLRFQFPNLQANAERVRQERMERERRSKEILQNKFEALKMNLSSIKEEIQSTIDEIGECLEIVRPTEEEPMPFCPLDDEDFEELHSLELRRIRHDSIKEGEKIHENNENKVVFDALRELYKLLVTKHFISVQEWISVLIKVDASGDNRARDSMLKEFIDIRNHLQAVKKKCELSGFALPDTRNHDQEEDDFWEEGKIESTNIGISGTPNEPSENLPTVSTPKNMKKVSPESGIEKLKSKDSHVCKKNGEANSSSVRAKLLDEAPVIEWGSFLDSWGSNRDVLANQRGLEVENHWGRVDYDAVIPAEKIAELNLHATVYKEEQVKKQPCHAPLCKGGLCQRRDLEVCPFHGPIIPRDDKGHPINQSPPMDEASVNLGADAMEQLAKQAVNNVRDRENEVAKKRKSDKQAEKRAKLAKVREHNEAVLRDAALVSTSRSEVFADEDMVATSGERWSAKKKSETLAAMLRKKVTAKDRLSQRLLNTRARDSTRRQLTLGEDEKYREAFPNQW